MENKETLMSERDENILKQAIKNAKELSDFISDLDYELSTFNRAMDRAQRFSYFKFTVSIFIALVAGGFISTFTQKQMNEYYLENEIKKLHIEQKKIDLLDDYGITIVDDKTIQIYRIKDGKSKVWSNENYDVLEIEK